MVTTQNNNPNRQGREGALNPMFGKSHSQETKNKISQTQKKRYDLIRKQLKRESTEDSDRRIDPLNLYIQQGKINTMKDLEDNICKLFQEERLQQIIEHTVNNYLSQERSKL